MDRIWKNTGVLIVVYTLALYGTFDLLTHGMDEFEMWQIRRAISREVGPVPEPAVTGSPQANPPVGRPQEHGYEKLLVVNITDAKPLESPDPAVEVTATLVCKDQKLNVTGMVRAGENSFEVTLGANLPKKGTDCNQTEINQFVGDMRAVLAKYKATTSPVF